MNKTKPWLHSPKATAEIIKKYDFRFRKSFGQNFLIDANIIDKITEAADLNQDDVVLEIGPGIGTLTQHLAYAAKKVIAVEIDTRLMDVLTETLADYDNVRLINEDALKLDIEGVLRQEDTRKVKVIANLPYYVTTPVIMRLLEVSEYVSSLTIMVQKEVAERLAARPGNKDYGALTLAVQYYSDVQRVTDVSPACFMPRPEVTSCVIQMNIKKERISVRDEALMFSIIRAAFNQRRKTIMNALKNSGEMGFTGQQIEAALQRVGIDPKIRGEALSLAEFAMLADSVDSSDPYENLCDCVKKEPAARPIPDFKRRRSD